MAPGCWRWARLAAGERMQRRDILSLPGGLALVLARPAVAQRELPLVAVLVPGTEALANSRAAAIRQGLREAGLAEGVDYTLAVRHAGGVFDRLPGLALELAALRPRVIVASAAAAVAVHKTVPDLPMVFTSYAADPIKAGFAQSYVRP